VLLDRWKPAKANLIIHALCRPLEGKHAASIDIPSPSYGQFRKQRFRGFLFPADDFHLKPLLKTLVSWATEENGIALVSATDQV